MTTDEMWPYLRRLRSKFGTPTGGDKRGQVFRAALEQSEQLFRASAGVGTEAQPLTLFYGLSQLGRAISAAIPGEDWELRGHGITAKGLTGPMPSIILCDQYQGAFTQLATTLKSPSLDVGVTLGQVFAALPESAHFPLGEAKELAPLQIRPALRPLLYQATFGNHVPTANADVSGLPGTVLESSDVRVALTEALSHYPDLAGFTLPNDVQLRTDRRGITARIGWPVDDGENFQASVLAHTASVLAHTTSYAFEHQDGYGYVFPALNHDRSLHPLLTWWAMLFGLSMLARYEPAAWQAAIDVDQSPHAVPLEHILKEGIRVIPWMAYRIIGDNTGWAE